MNGYQLDHLDELEAESMFALREVLAQFERRAILSSNEKGSMSWRIGLRKPSPARIPMPLVHIDTADNFTTALNFRNCSEKSMNKEFIMH